MCGVPEVSDSHSVFLRLLAGKGHDSINVGAVCRKCSTYFCIISLSETELYVGSSNVYFLHPAAKKPTSYPPRLGGMSGDRMP